MRRAGAASIFSVGILSSALLVWLAVAGCNKTCVSFTSNPSTGILAVKVSDEKQPCTLTTVKGTVRVQIAGLSGFSWHCLRHTFASRLVMAGVDIRTVQELLGHKTVAMTVRYSHLAPKYTLAAVERLDTLSESPTDTSAFEQPAVAVPVLQ